MLPKVSIIGGAGNVGVTTAMRIANSGLADCILVDLDLNLAMAKKMDLEDSNAILKSSSKVQATDKLDQIKDSQVVIITAGSPRKHGMNREDLLKKNAKTILGITQNIKNFISQNSVVIIVTNPLDIMAYIGFKTLGIGKKRVFGMGGGLDAGRLTNIISSKLNCPNSDIESIVIGSHGKGMLPLPRFSRAKDKLLQDIFSKEELKNLTELTVGRGGEIVKFQGSGSAYFGPSAALFNIVKSIITNETLVTCASTYLEGEYGLSDICIGVPVQINQEGISKILELNLNDQEKNSLKNSATGLEEYLALLRQENLIP